MSKNWAASHRTTFCMTGLDHTNPNYTFPVTQLLIQDMTGCKSKKQIKDGHHCTELCSVAVAPTWIVNSENDDIKEDAENVDRQTDKNWILILRKGNAPNIAAEEHQIVDQDGLEKSRNNFILFFLSNNM